MKTKKVMYGVMTIFLAVALLISVFAAVPKVCAQSWPLTYPKWRWDWASSDMKDSNQVMMTPVVADVTGPGLGGPDGIPDIIFATFDQKYPMGNYVRHGIIRVISGFDGTDYYSITSPDYAVVPIGSIAVADIDSDGWPEIIAITDDQPDDWGIATDSNRLICFEGEDGYCKWISNYDGLPFTSGGGPTIADMNSDGIPEIIVGNRVFRSNDGALLWEAGPGRGAGRHLSCVADLDFDGTPEIIAGNCAYSIAISPGSTSGSGTVLWSNSDVALPDGDGFNAIADFNLDGTPEVVLVGWDGAAVNKGPRVWVLAGPTGRTLCASGLMGTPPRTGGGPPCIADVDGDGYPEIGVATGNTYEVLEVAPTLSACTKKWEVVTDDGSSGITSSSAFDFDQDGRYDIVYRDENKLYIFGEQGANKIHWEKKDCPSYTAYEMPVVADVDKDMHAEIVVPLNNMKQSTLNTGIEVYGNPDWPCARRIWNQHTYHITNIDWDAKVPRIETNNWETYNNYRVQTLPVDHFKCYQVEGGQPVGASVELQDQFVNINATVQEPEFFCNPVQKFCGNVTIRIENPDLHLTLYNITCPEVLAQWSVEVDNQFGEQVLDVSDPVLLAVPTVKGACSQADLPPCLDHFLVYNATGQAVNVPVNLFVWDVETETWHVEANVTVLRPVYFANPVQKTCGDKTEIQNPEVHLVFYEIEIDDNETLGGYGRTLVNNQFGEYSLNVTRPRLLAVPSEKKKVTTQVLDHFKCYNVTGSSIGETVELQDQFVTINAMVKDPEFFCNPVEKNHCGHFVAPISHPDWHLTLYSILPDEMTPTWSVNVSNQFGQQHLIVSDPVLLAVPTQKVAWLDFDGWKFGGKPPEGLDHFLLYRATGPDLKVKLKLLADQWHSEANVTVVRPVYFANPVQKTRDCEVTPIENPEGHLVFYEIVGEPYSMCVYITNQFVSNFPLAVMDPQLLAVPSEKTGFAERPMCFVATAAYGTPMAEEIQILREFRDEYLLTSAVGQAFVDFYYKTSPPVAEFITEHPVLKSVVRVGLAPVVAISIVAVNTTPAEKMAIVGLLVLVSVALAVLATRRRGMTMC